MQSLLASMEGIPFVLRKTLIARGLRAAGNIIKQRFQLLAPDDPKTIGSRIRDAAEVNVTEQTATGAIAKIGVNRKGFALIFSEQGTVKQRAKPTLGPAFDSAQDEAYEKLSEVIGEGIEKEFYRRST